MVFWSEEGVLPTHIHFHQKTWKILEDQEHLNGWHSSWSGRRVAGGHSFGGRTWKTHQTEDPRSSWRVYYTYIGVWRDGVSMNLYRSDRSPATRPVKVSGLVQLELYVRVTPLHQKLTETQFPRRFTTWVCLRIRSVSLALCCAVPLEGFEPSSAPTAMRSPRSPRPVDRLLKRNTTCLGPVVPISWRGCDWDQDRHGVSGASDSWRIVTCRRSPALLARGGTQTFDYPKKAVPLVTGPS